MSGQPGGDRPGNVWHHAGVSFDLVVWAMEAGGTPDDVRAANDLCRQGEHLDGAADGRVDAFYAALTARYPDRGPAATADGTPWADAPLHVATDHVQMRLDEPCADEVLETIEQLAGQHGLMLLDLQDGSVYPPAQPVG